MARFQEMNREELQREIKRLSEENARLTLIGETSHQAVIEQRLYLAKSYLVNPSEYELNTWYHVEGFSGCFELKRLNGVMGWGNWENSWEEVAFPLARLIEIRDCCSTGSCS
ncbi:DUF1811 family protein [Risungbinella massiliensis]|uniref:DUF1811 family protein n=1 Tax=Risungbinella massiliensis TaxID=1329796 RepID=UPI0005CBEA77|nr:DUF1811 family protein [Risungbinella massiliensis]